MIQWKKIEGFEDYEISSSGVVRRVTSARGAVIGSEIKWHLQTSNGYPNVRLRKNGKSYSKSIHRLVSEHFIGPRPQGMQTRHIDGCKTNNSVSNLAYGTAKENGEDNVKHRVMQRGEKHSSSVLTEIQAIDIKIRLSNGETATNIAKNARVPRTAIYHIKYGRTWAWLNVESANNRSIDMATQ